MSDKLVIIAEYGDSVQAEMARQVLADFGILAVILEQNTFSLGAKLQVLESVADQAKQILDEQEDAHEPEDYEVGDESDESDEPYDPDKEEW